MAGRLGDWVVYCDICGQKHYASETSKLPAYTGRSGLIVCKHDFDKIDPGLIPYTPRKEQNVSYVRVNHTNTNDARPLIDLEDMTYQYYLVSSQDGIQIVSSQDDAYIISTTPV